jgi:hypothetical protein
VAYSYNFKKTYIYILYQCVLHYLKSNCGSFSAAYRLWNISLEGTAVVRQHTEAPHALVPLFHVRFSSVWDSVGRQNSPECYKVSSTTPHLGG